MLLVVILYANKIISLDSYTPRSAMALKAGTDGVMMKGVAPTSSIGERSHHRNITRSFEGRVALPTERSEHGN
jgi:hypothetical protein